MLRIGVNGIAGRMGREVVAAADGVADLRVAGGFDPAAVTDSLAGAIPLMATLESLLDDIDVLIDFSTPEATVAAAGACAARGIPLVSGTTGLAAEHRAALERAAARTAIFHARNMSVGISALAAVLPALVRTLDGYDIEIVEAHHRHKADAPSGTALVLAETIAAGLGRPLDELASYGRRGLAPRVAGEIGIHAVRGGGNAGEHTVMLADEGEEIRVTHRAFSRRTFALGALRAARYVASRPPGRYGMTDLLTDRP